MKEPLCHTRTTKAKIGMRIEEYIDEQRMVADAQADLSVAAVKILPVLHHSADYISISFMIIEPFQLTLKTEYRLSRW